MTSVRKITSNLTTCITAAIRTTVPTWKDAAVNEATDAVIHRAIQPAMNDAVRYALVFVAFYQYSIFTGPDNGDE